MARHCGSLTPMEAIIIPLPEEDLAFLRAYSEAHGTSAEAFLARQARNLREQLQTSAGVVVTAASGIIDPAIDGEAAHRARLERKYG